MDQWQIGDVTIKRIVEMEFATPGEWLLPNATAQNVVKETWLTPTFADASGNLLLSIHALTIESLGKKIIVDTCLGNDKVRGNADWHKLNLPFLEALKKGGYTPESIDTVICTHLHVDHVGWNTTLVDGKWKPTFSNARYIFGGTEWDFWSRFEESGDLREAVEDSVRPVVHHEMAELVDSTHKITPEVWLEPTPGHTPGHHSVRISSKGKEAVITGDLLHHPVQFAHPEWHSSFDADDAMAKRTRRAFCERYADKDVLIFGTHFANPSCGRIVSSRDGFGFVAAK